MEKNPSENAFQEVIKKSQAFRERLRQQKEKQTHAYNRDAEEEAVREGFDRAIHSC
jgi:hypothetical protein